MQEDCKFQASVENTVTPCPKIHPRRISICLLSFNISISNFSEGLEIQVRSGVSDLDGDKAMA